MIFLVAAFPFRTEIHGTNFSLSILARRKLALFAVNGACIQVNLNQGFL